MQSGHRCPNQAIALGPSPKPLSRYLRKNLGDQMPFGPSKTGKQDMEGPTVDPCLGLSLRCAFRTDLGEMVSSLTSVSLSVKRGYHVRLGQHLSYWGPVSAAWS